MPIGPGKYDDFCTHVRVETEAAVAIVLVIGGKRGSGFSIQADGSQIPPVVLAGVLRQMADELSQGETLT